MGAQRYRLLLRRRRLLRLLLRRSRINRGSAGLLLLSAELLQNLLGGLRPCVGLTWLRLLLLILGIGLYGLYRLCGLGLGLILGVVFGVILIIISIVVLRHLRIPRSARLREDRLPVERLSRGNAVCRRRPWFAARGGLGVCRRWL